MSNKMQKMFILTLTVFIFGCNNQSLVKNSKPLFQKPAEAFVASSKTLSQNVPQIEERRADDRLNKILAEMTQWVFRDEFRDQLFGLDGESDLMRDLLCSTSVEASNVQLSIATLNALGLDLETAIKEPNLSKSGLLDVFKKVFSSEIELSSVKDLHKKKSKTLSKYEIECELDSLVFVSSLYPVPDTDLESATILGAITAIKSLYSVLSELVTPAARKLGEEAIRIKQARALQEFFVDEENYSDLGQNIDTLANYLEDRNRRKRHRAMAGYVESFIKLRGSFAENSADSTKTLITSAKSCATFQKTRYFGMPAIGKNEINLILNGDGDRRSKLQKIRSKLNDDPRTKSDFISCFGDALNKNKKKIQAVVETAATYDKTHDLRLDRSASKLRNNLDKLHRLSKGNLTKEETKFLIEETYNTLNRLVSTGKKLVETASSDDTKKNIEKAIKDVFDSFESLKKMDMSQLFN